ncbi:MAG: hypothetical protein R3F19_16175 [Verrucomicrobiales bacterium]
MVRSTNTEAALEWATTLPPAASLASSTSIIGEWSRADAAAAADFISGLPEGELRQSATAAMTRSMASVDPERAWQWALTVDDPDARYNAVKDVIDSWSEIDSHAAKAVLAKAPITEAQRDHIAERIRWMWER